MRFGSERALQPPPRNSWPFGVELPGSCCGLASRANASASVDDHVHGERDAVHAERVRAVHNSRLRVSTFPDYTLIVAYSLRLLLGGDARR